MKVAEDLRRAVLQAAIEGKLTGGSLENWRFVRLGDIALSIQYGYNAPAREEGTVRMVRISDIQNNNIQWNNVPYCEISEDEMQKYLLAKNDILFARTGGTVGKSYLVGNMPEKAIYAGYLIRLRINDEINPQYVKYFMESESYWKQLRTGTTATAQPNCNGKTLSQMIIPLPPIDEQHRIVSRLDAILPKIAELESAENELEALERKFPGNMRDALLQAAIEGKLTGSNTDNWQFVRLGDISSYGEHVVKVSAENIPANSWILDLEDIEKGGRILTKRAAQEIKSIGDKAIFHQGDILFSKLRPYLQKILIAPSDGFCTPELIPFHCYGEIEPEYMLYFLKAPSVDHEINSKSYGVKMPRVGANTMINLLVPLPPLDEQHKIVSRLNELLPLCEGMKGE
ncbi:MAG: restriction endonuclease subunit S [Synergistaceae bacterium]|nr:restriction endonuclease subunit S [Synergistaceae bacterium]